MKLFFTWLLFVILISQCLPVLAVDASAEPLRMPKLSEDEANIKIDGRLDESIWAKVPSYDNLTVLEPDTLEDAPLETRIHFLYTDKGLYIGVWSEQSKETLVSRLSSRDQFITRDDISITIDSSGQGLYGYWFGINLGGTMIDGTVLPERQFTRQWDGPWSGASAEVEGGWSAEMFLPWSMMTMPDVAGNVREMGFYISRAVAHKNERWGWPALPNTNSVFMSKLQKFELQGINPGQQFTFYPYASGTYDNINDQGVGKAGFDLYWRPTSNLQLTSTINPDFGSVESDNVVVNLTSFETFFPEKRPFFLEGQEIFVTSPRAQQGRNSRGPPTTLVNTRRIGSSPKSPDIVGFELDDIEANQPTELLAAAKITGQQNKFRYGVLAAAEDDTTLKGQLNNQDFQFTQDGRNFGVARFLYEDTSNGDRRSLGWMSTMVAHPQEDAVTHGLDGHYTSSDGSLSTDVQLLYSDVDSVKGAGGFFDVKYTPRQGRTHNFSFDYFDRKLDINDLGFLRRNDAIGGRYSYKISESSVANLKSRFTRFAVTQEFNNDGKNVRSGFFALREREYQNRSIFFTELNYFPARWDDINSDGNGSYKIDGRLETGIFWRNDRAKKLNIGLGTFINQEQLGGRTISLESEFTFKPTDRFSFILGLNYQDKEGWLINWSGRSFSTYNSENWRPRIETDFFLSAKQQFRITAQWVGIKAFEDQRWMVPLKDGDLMKEAIPAGDSSRNFSISRLVFQARYRWEIAPLSDLFIVYTRGSDVPSDPSDSFTGLLHSSWTDPAVDVLVVKLRYRLGS